MKLQLKDRTGKTVSNTTGYDSCQSWSLYMWHQVTYTFLNMFKADEFAVSDFDILMGEGGRCKNR